MNNETEPSVMPFLAPLMPIEEVLAEFHAFNRSFNSAMIASLNEDGHPDATYAPTLQHEGKFYLYISELAAHTKNLLNHPMMSLIFIEPETEANLFRRQRSMIRCDAKAIVREEAQWSLMLDIYEENFGKMMRNLRELKDFHLFELTPVKATYVRGFAQAYHINGSQLNEINHIRDRGHGKSSLKKETA